MPHANNGACQACHAIIMKYPGFYSDLLNWFLHFQEIHPECHVSCAGRGFVDQEVVYHRGASLARYGESAHNYNAALDLFLQINGKYSLPKEWFQTVLVPSLPPWIEWAGNWQRMKEFPHVEIKGWVQLVKNKTLRLVEPMPQVQQGA